MAKSKKTDNHDPTAKLELRRYFLEKYHSAEPPHVLDCCQGSGLLWEQLRKEFPVASYWGLDVKRKKGRLKIDSVRVLQQAGWPQNIIDVDTYGSPWKHWRALLLNGQFPLTVFLTIGSVILAQGGGRSLSKVEAEAIGLGSLKLPQGFGPRLGIIATDYLLSSPYKAGINIVEAVEAVSHGNARYIGVRLEKATDGVGAPPVQHTQVIKELEHV